MNYESVPQELKALPNWVGWKLESRDNKPTKVPYSSTHEMASSTDQKTWRAFTDVCGIPPSKEKGIGFVFNGNGIIGIDIDHCIVDNKIINKEFENIVETLNSYTEVSPSGTGLHIFIRCAEPPYPTGKKKGDVEIYSKERYFTVTGDVWLDQPIATVPIDIVRALLDPFVNPLRPAQEKYTPTISPNLSDDDIIRIASNASNSTKFERLMDGHIGDYANDRSVADMALASILAFYTTDANQIERIMRMSGLVREKWDKHQKYLREYTIAKAIQMCNHHFEPRYEVGDVAQGKASADAIMSKPAGKQTSTSQSVMEKLTDKEIEDIIATSRLCDDLPPFPEITHPFFKKWMVLGNRLMYSHISYHFGNLLAVASMAITRRVSVLIATKYIYPNFDIMLIGTSTISGKSFSSDTAVSEFGIHVAAIKPSIVDPTDTTELKRKSCSNPRLIQDLSKANNMLWYYDEAKEFFDDCGDRGWNAPIVGTLCTAYDGGYLERGLSTRSSNKKKSRGDEEDNTEENKWICENPFLTLLFNMTINQIKEASTPKIVGSGFFYRWLWFLENGGEKRKNVTASKEDLQEVKEIRDELLRVGNILKSLRANDICFRVNDKVEEWSLNISKKSDDETFQSATGRSTIHIYKIAMVLTVFDPEFQKKIFDQKEYPIQLELPDKWVNEAIMIVEKYLLPRMMVVAEYANKVDSNNKQQRVLSDLANLKGVSDHTTLLRRTKLDAKEFLKAIDTLKESEDITSVIKNGKTVYCLRKHKN